MSLSHQSLFVVRPSRARAHGAVVSSGRLDVVERVVVERVVVARCRGCARVRRRVDVRRRARESSRGAGASRFTRTSERSTRLTRERRAQRCYGVSRRVDALVRDGEDDGGDARRVHRTGDVAGRFRYACAGYAARAIPFYPEGRRRPTMEERKRGTEFPMCRGVEILVAERVVDRSARDADARDASSARRAAEGDDDGRGREANDLASAAKEGLRRWNASAGKIASKMHRHARFVGDALYALVVGRR